MHKNNSKSYCVYTVDGLSIFDRESIYYCTSERGCSRIHTFNGESYSVSKSLNRIQAELADLPILRVSQSALINMMYIKHVYRKVKIVELRNLEEIPYTIGYNRIRTMITEQISSVTTGNQTNGLVCVSDTHQRKQD